MFPCCSWEESISPSLSTFVELPLSNQLDVLGFLLCGKVKDQQRTPKGVKILQAIGGWKTHDRILGFVGFFPSSQLICLETSLELTLICVCSEYICLPIDREQPWKNLNREKRKRLTVKLTEVYSPLSLNDLYSHGFEATRSRFITMKERENHRTSHSDCCHVNTGRFLSREEGAFQCMALWGSKNLLCPGSHSVWF